MATSEERVHEEAAAAAAVVGRSDARGTKADDAAARQRQSRARSCMLLCCRGRGYTVKDAFDFVADPLHRGRGLVRGEPERVLEALQPLRADAGQASVDPALQQRDKRGCQRCPAWR